MANKMESEMQKIWKLLAIMAVLFVLPATPAMAQATRTWVSGVGDDLNPCSRTAPCKTWAGAISKTAAAGEINCLDPGAFGAVTITKSLTIRCEGEEGGALASAGANAITINAASTDRIILDNIDLEGAGTGLNGVNIVSARDVVIKDTSIRGFLATGGNCVKVNTTTTIRVALTNSFLFNCSTGVSVLNTNGTGTAKVYDTVIGAMTIAGITVSTTGNKADISASEIYGTPKSFNITTGGVVNSYNNNVLNGTATDAPVIVPLG